MAQVLMLSQFVKPQGLQSSPDTPSASEAISNLSAALAAFSASINAYGACMRAQSRGCDQQRMVEAWELVSAGLRNVMP